MRRLLTLAALAVSLAATDARAQLATHVAQCSEGNASAEQLIVHCTAAIKTNRLSPEGAARAFLNRGVAFFAREQYTLALRDYEFAERYDPTLALASANKGNTLVRMNKLDDAVIAYSSALSLEPNDVPALIGRGGALLRLGRLDSALADFRRAVDKAPDSLAANFNYGVALSDAGRDREALRYFSTAIRMDGENAGLMMGRAGSHAAVGDLNRAYQDYSRAIEIDPGFALAYFRRGRLLLDDGRSSAANADLAEAYQLGFDDPWLAQYIAGLGQ